MHNKYQCYPKIGSMFNSVPKFAQFEERTNKFFKSRQVFKVENWNKKLRNSRIFRKTFLGNIVKMIYVKYECHPKSRSILNHVPKNAHCQTRSKFVYVKKSFQSQKPKPNFWNSKIFLKKVLRNIVKIRAGSIPKFQLIPILEF